MYLLFVKRIAYLILSRVNKIRINFDMDWCIKTHLLILNWIFYIHRNKCKKGEWFSEPSRNNINVTLMSKNWNDGILIMHAQLRLYFFFFFIVWRLSNRLNIVQIRTYYYCPFVNCCSLLEKDDNCMTYFFC